MLRSRRAATLLGLCAAGVLAVASPVVAQSGWGSATCEQIPTPACQLGAGSTGTAPAPDAPPAGSASPSSPDSGSGSDTEGSTGARDAPRCTYVRSDYRPPPGGAVPTFQRPAPADGGVLPAAAGLPGVPPGRSAGRGPGAWYVWRCTAGGAVEAFYRPPIWIPDAPGAGPAEGPSPGALAEVVREQLRFPAVRVAVSPPGAQLVTLPTWMWLRAGWQRITASAAVPGVAVTVAASPRSVSWAMGDGSTVRCTGPGTAFPPGANPAASSPDCGHVYRRASAPGVAYPVTVTVRWAVTWSGAGQAGVFPDMTTTGSVRVRVVESQALNGH